MSNVISVVVRTMPGREKFLDKCLFVLSGQTYSHIEIVVVAQLLESSVDIGPLKKVVSRWTNRFTGTQFLTHVSASDARSRSLNLGKHAANGRYNAFLDDDDKIYPHHYSKLIESLQKSNYAWSYSDTIRALYNEHGQLIDRSSPFKRDAYSFLDHLRGNFIPIHSFVIDMERVTDVGDVDETMDKNEDYEFLLRLAFKHEPIYVPGFGAEYCIRSDGTNTVCDGTQNTQSARQKFRLWVAANHALNARKLDNFGWWVSEVEKIAEKTTTPHVTQTPAVFPKILQDYYSSTSWRVTRPLRNAVRRLRGHPYEPRQISIPEDDEIAYHRIIEILRSTSWEITAPLRLAKRIVAGR